MSEYKPKHASGIVVGDNGRELPKVITFDASREQYVTPEFVQTLKDTGASPYVIELVEALLPKPVKYECYCPETHAFPDALCLPPRRRWA